MESDMENTGTESQGEDSSDNGKADTALTDALAKLSLTTELDSALLDHLNILDKYMFHMECLSQLFRMAFFELAQANRDKSASGGSRIGEAGYDQRMQATRRIHIDSDSDDVFMLKNFSKAEETGEDTADGTKLVDPLRWYGLLAPQSLKDAQSRFVKVLEESIEVANAMARLQSSEAAIGVLRKKYNSSKSEAIEGLADSIESPTFSGNTEREDNDIPVQAQVIYSKEKEVFDTQADHSQPKE